jgi:hypothetical protein
MDVQLFLPLLFFDLDLYLIIYQLNQQIHQNIIIKYIIVIKSKIIFSFYNTIIFEPQSYNIIIIAYNLNYFLRKFNYIFLIFHNKMDKL